MTSVQQVFVLRQFFVTAFYPARGGGPGQGGNGSAPPPVPKNAEPPAAAPKRGRRDSAGDEGAQIAKTF